MNDSAKALDRLVSAIESDGLIDVADVYGLDIERFNLALQLLQERRLD